MELLAGSIGVRGGADAVQVMLLLLLVLLLVLVLLLTLSLCSCVSRSSTLRRSARSPRRATRC